MKKYLKWFARYGGLVIFVIFLYSFLFWWIPLYKLQLGLKAVFVINAIPLLLFWVAYGFGIFDGDY